jgi:ornithine cyclodeaminase
MLALDAGEISNLVALPDLIDALELAFGQPHVVPPRLVMRVPGDRDERHFLGMAAADVDGVIAAKLATNFPDNPKDGVPTNQGVIILFGSRGDPIAVLYAPLVTYLRTAAASALASRYLSRADSRDLVIVGTGALAPYMAAAHCVVRPIERISVWGRDPAKAQLTAAQVLKQVGASVEVIVASDLSAAVTSADIISCATDSATPVVEGEWLREGAFVDAVGSFSPVRRETDDAVVTRARLFVDTLDGALSEAGDLLEPMKRGIIGRNDIEGELTDLVRGRVRGRSSDREITFFKSVGSAIEDLAAARLIVAAADAGAL